MSDDQPRASRGDTVRQTANAAYESMRQAGIPASEARSESKRAAEAAHRAADNANVNRSRR